MRSARVGIALLGAAMVAAAIAANQAWLDRHFLPDFFVSRQTYLHVETSIRLMAGALGLLLALLSRPLARFLARDPVRTAALALAVVASFGAAELVLRRTHLRAKEEVPARKEPLRHLDPRLGWLFVPSRVGYQRIEGRAIRYAFDSHGYRVRGLREPVDFRLPTVVFTGESMMVGEKLQWEETFAAQAARMMGAQSANIAVSGFATDQAYLRLRDELPRFAHPQAVVMLFTPSLFDRNLDDDRPHLGPGLVWLPARPQRSRLWAIATRLVRYRSDEDIERGVAVTVEVLRATCALARARGAAPLIVVPQFGAEGARERELRQRILDQPGLPYVRVELDPAWRVRDDGHPDPRAARRLAAAIAGAFSAPRRGP